MQNEGAKGKCYTTYNSYSSLVYLFLYGRLHINVTWNLPVKLSCDVYTCELPSKDMDLQLTHVDVSDLCSSNRELVQHHFLSLQTMYW